MGRLLVTSMKSSASDACYELCRYMFASPFMIDSLLCWDPTAKAAKYTSLTATIHVDRGACALPLLLTSAATSGDLICLALT
jgi:hypothetical protein